MADKAGAPDKNDTPGAEGQAPDKVEALTEQIKTLTAKLDSGLTGLRSMYDRQLNDLRERLKIAKTAEGDRSYDRGYGAVADSDRAGNQGMNDDERTEFEGMRFETGKAKFERTYPLYGSDAKVKAAVDTLLNDQNRVADFLIRNEKGKIDYYRTYRNAFLEVQNQHLEAARAATEQARTEAEKNRKQTLADVALSGETVEELPEGLTLEAIEAMPPEKIAELIPGLRKRKPPVGV
jgi:hypothetical protein